MSVNLGTSYSVARSTGRCAATGAVFAPGQRFVATLVEREGSDELERQDFSDEAWVAGARPVPPFTLFASWRAVHAAVDQRGKLVMDEAELMDLFEQLAGSTQPKQQAFRFVLTLLLMRKKALSYEGQREGMMLVKPRKSGLATEPPVYEVVDPKLDADTLAGVIEQLGEVIGDASAPSGGGGA